MNEKRILHLTLEKTWFDQILANEKKVEYREVKDYWIARLRDKTFDEVHFTNGYGKDKPFLAIECKEIIEDDFLFNIYLGNILRTENIVHEHA